MKEIIKYQVNNNVFNSAITAWDQASNKNTRPILQLHSNFNDYNWTMEPIDSINKLEDEHVKKLSQLGKVLRLFYSGGTDSHSIAHAFARNKIDIKYTLVSYKNIINTSLDSDNYIKAKVDKLKLLHNEYGLNEPDYEVIVVDETVISNHFTTNFYEDSIWYNCNKSFNVNQFPSLIRYSKWKKNETLNIFGIEKPRLFEDSKGIFWQISDTMSLYGYSNDTDIHWFYCSAHALDITAKQAWNVLNYIDHKWPDLPKGKVLEAFQTQDKFYYEWCKVLGRQTNLWWAMQSKESKAKTSTFESTSDDRYTHLRYYQDGHKAWKNYTELFQRLKDITNSYTIESVFSNKHYLRLY